MTKKIQIQLLLVVLICLFAISPVWGVETGYIHYCLYSTLPTKTYPDTFSTTPTWISCYNAFTGELLNCSFSHEVIGLKTPFNGSGDIEIANNGGHTHNYDTHPYFWPVNGELEFDYDNNPNPLVVSGKTFNDSSMSAMIFHHMPEIAGNIVTETVIKAPAHWLCVSGCFTYNSSKYETTLDVGVKEIKFINYPWYTGIKLVPLTELPDPSSEDHYEKLRGYTSTHPKGHYGTTDTITKLKDIAKKYYKLSGRTLSVNDMSLPKGGLFDWKATWNPPHASHRTGTNADINQDKIPCGENDDLKNATEYVAGDQPYPKLQCEDEYGNFTPDGEFYHYEFY